MGLGHHLEAPARLRARDRRDRGRVLGVDVAAAAVAEAVVLAGCALVVAFAVDSGRTGERMPAESPRGAGHELREAGTAQRRHRVGAAPRALEDVAALVDHAADVAGLPGDADGVLHMVVVRLELVEPERPVLHRRAGRQPRRPVAAGGRARDVEVPRVQPPALGPVVERRAADGVHHRVDRRPRLRRRRVPPVHRDLAVRLLDGVGPAAVVVEQLVRGVVAGAQPAARLQADHLQPRLREREDGNAASRAEADDGDVGLRELNGHGSSSRGRRRTPGSRRPRPAAPAARRPSAAAPA